MDIAVVGLGKMGKPIAERLLDAGHVIHAFNRSPQVVRDLAARGALASGSASDAAAQAELVLTALPTIESVRTVYDEMAAVAQVGQLFVDHSTVSIATNRQCARRLEARGADFLDAPVSGGPAGAKAGSLTVMVGGDQKAFDRALPVFKAYGKNIRLCGPTGSGQAVKLVNQLLVAVHTAAASEAAVLGFRLGAKPAILEDLIGTSFGGSAMLLRNLPRFRSRDFSGATPVALILKDLGIIHEEARQAGVPTLLGAIAEQRYIEAASMGLGTEDMSALVKLWEAAAGVTLQSSSDDD